MWNAAAAKPAVRHPLDRLRFAEGVLPWTNRPGAYAFLLATDRYPPLRLGV